MLVSATLADADKLEFSLNQRKWGLLPRLLTVINDTNSNELRR